MNETRRLDVLAVVGLIVGVAAVLLLAHLQPQNACWKNTTVAKVRAAFLKPMPESDLKADYDILLPTTTDFQAKPSIEKIRQAAAKYPNSARLQFRLGTYGKDDQALRRAAELDPNNALPLYCLASRSPADKAAALIGEANRRKTITWYPLPQREGNLVDTLITVTNSSIAFPIYTILRDNARNVGKYALELRKQGRTDQAVAGLNGTREMGWKFTQQPNSTIIDLMLSTSIIAIGERYERQIYTEIGSKTGLAELARERARLDYLNAGEAYYIKALSAMDIPDILKHIAVFLILAYIGIVQLIILLVSGIWWEILLLRSRRQAGSEVHLEATKVFSAGRLIKLYALIFATVIAVLSAATAILNSNTIFSIATVYAAALVLPVVLFWRANVIYRRACRQAAESAGQEISKAIPDKREFTRRMIGVQGGAVIFLVTLGVLVAGGTKVVSGAYPWQPYPSMAQIHQRESQFVSDLLAGKIKVPQKYIDEEKRREAKRKQPSK